MLVERMSMMEVMMEKIVLSSVLSLSPSPTSELDVTSEGRSVQSDGLESDRSDGSNAGEIIHVFIEGVVVLVVLIVKFIAASAIQPRSNSAGSHVWWQSTFMEIVASICTSSNVASKVIRPTLRDTCPQFHK